MNAFAPGTADHGMVSMKVARPLNTRPGHIDGLPGELSPAELC